MEKSQRAEVGERLIMANVQIAEFWVGTIDGLRHFLRRMQEQTISKAQTPHDIGFECVTLISKAPSLLKEAVSSYFSVAIDRMPEVVSSLLPSILGVVPAGAEREQVECAGCGMICFRGDTCPRCGTLVGGVPQ